MSVTKVTTPLPPMLCIADLVEKGQLDEAFQLFETTKDKVGEVFKIRAPALIDLLAPHKSSEERAKEMAAIFRQYASMEPPTALQKLAAASTGVFHYPVIFVMQKLLVQSLMDDDCNTPFLNDQFFPALHSYLKTGCLEPLIKALQSEEVDHPYAELFLQLIDENQGDLRKPIGTFIPERDFPGCFVLAKQQKRLVAETMPFWKRIYRCLSFSKLQALLEAEGTSTENELDPSDDQLEKIFSHVSSDFKELMQRAYTKAENRFRRSLDYRKVVSKFSEPNSATTFGEYQSQTDFAVSTYERIKRDLMFLRDFNLLRHTYKMSKLEMEWQEFTSLEPDPKFSTFIANKVAKITEKWEARKWCSELGQWSQLMVKDPFYAQFYKSIKFLINLCNYEIQIYSSLFALPLEAGRIMGIKDDFDGTTTKKPEPADGKEKKRQSPKTLPFTPIRQSPVTVPSSKTRTSPIPMASRASPANVPKSSPRTSPVTIPLGVPEILQPVFTPITTLLRNKDAQRSFKNGVLHLENLTVLLERLKTSSTNIFSTFSLIGASLATAVENLQKSFLYEEGIRFQKSTHNLVRLCADIPFISLRHIVALRDVNFAERDIRYIGAHANRPSPFQRVLSQVRSSPALALNIERIKTLLLRTFPLLCKLVNRGAPNELDFEEVVQNTLDMIQEPATIAAMPPRHPEIIPITEILAKAISIIPVNDSNRQILVNLAENLLFRLREEINHNPTPHGMRLHYSTLFRSLPLIAEELIKLCFIKQDVKKSPFAFKHDLLKMLQEVKVKVPKELTDFLARIPEYARMQRYPARATYKDKMVKFVSDCIQKIQGKNPNPIEKGFKPSRGSPDDAFQELESALQNEFKLLEAFTTIMVKLL